ncbi:sodium/proline symporter PutP [Alteromonas sp. a30]|uniref:sodium/proline symporter PutP n=1 Tax=Alteromonas sp. a30 TaxID=2730917 RepID=UPI00227F03F5|nr:sodium/proline symporter PutP [Alteromonas sp. a30]MCY7295239.1 sodium/proline symporter PutP [Alteromonas sp. a30]
MNYQIISLGIYFVVMVGIGVYAYFASNDDMEGYVLGGRDVGPHVTALSAGASDMSGWMLMGLPGAMFVMGFDAIWIAMGLLLGALTNYIVVAPRLRTYTEMANDAITLPDFFAKRFLEEKGSLRLITSIVTILFFTLYTSAGLVAGGKLFESVFQLNYSLGVAVTAGVVVAYTLLGGFLAVSMTDFVQGCIIFVALIVVPLTAFQQFDTVNEFNTITATEIGSFMSSWESLTVLGLLSSLAWGLGYFGQPHILVRFMAIRSRNDIPTAKNIGMSWMTVTIIGALGTGLVGVAYTQKFDLALDDPETIFIVLSQLLFHPAISGFLLAAILAAIMSTISSQLLVSSSSLTEDILKVFFKSNSTSQSTLPGRIAVVTVAIVASIIALNDNKSVLSLVSNAWAGFGAAFGPLIILSLFWRNMTRAGALAGVIVGAATVLFWIYFPIEIAGKTLSQHLYEIIPGVIASSLAIVFVSQLSAKPRKEIYVKFDDVTDAIRS